MTEQNTDPEDKGELETQLTKPQSEEAKENEGEILSPDNIDADALEQMPPEMRQTIRSLQASFVQSSSRPVNPLFEKFTDAHIDKYLDYIQRDDDHEYELRRSNRWYYLIYVILALVALGFGIIYLLPRDKDFLASIITWIVIAAGGLGAGYGINERSKRS